MNNIKASPCNFVIGKPTDMTDNQCSSLYVAVETKVDGPWATSHWRPSQEELNVLNTGGLITVSLRLSHGGHPVMSMGTFKE